MKSDTRKASFSLQDGGREGGRGLGGNREWMSEETTQSTRQPTYMAEKRLELTSVHRGTSSHILPLMNKTTGLVNIDKAEDVTATMVTALQPDSGMSASHPPLNSNHTSGMEHVFQYSYSESGLLYTDDRTPARDSIPLPKAVLYLVMAALVVVVVEEGRWLLKVTVVKPVNQAAPLMMELQCSRLLPQKQFYDWVFGSRRVTNCNNTEINCISNNMSEMSESGERPRLVEMSYIFLNHTNSLGSNRPEETVVTIDETLQQQPPDTHSGT
ncbi:hypothetical protein EYF80_014992 [Liparis tanakae]|uniref:Uncharacterized protein n=1 Tax=Liparis tanakae TaxID=230148 RepID=A0A4Z2IBG4_9TELE|nr:hypothetical protein EYF80_014992 [Liparis tanakae]